MMKQDLFLKDMKNNILIGLIIYKIGVFLVNYGGDIEFQHIIVKNAEKPADGRGRRK